MFVASMLWLLVWKVFANYIHVFVSFDKEMVIKIFFFFSPIYFFVGL